MILSNCRLHDEAKTVADKLPMAYELKPVLERLYESDRPAGIRKWRGRRYSTHHRVVGERYYRYYPLQQGSWLRLACSLFGPRFMEMIELARG